MGILLIIGDGVYARVTRILVKTATKTKAHFKCTANRAHCSANCGAITLDNGRVVSVRGIGMCGGGRGATYSQ